MMDHKKSQTASCIATALGIYILILTSITCATRNPFCCQEEQCSEEGNSPRNQLLACGTIYIDGKEQKILVQQDGKEARIICTPRTKPENDI